MTTLDGPYPLWLSTDSAERSDFPVAHLFSSGNPPFERILSRHLDLKNISVGDQADSVFADDVIRYPVVTLVEIEEDGTGV